MPAEPLRAPSVLPAATRLPWPLPALLTWAACWAVMLAGTRAGWPVLPCATAALVLGLAAALAVAGTWRRVMVAGGFPLSALALAALQGEPAWPWGVALAAGVALYPLRAWADAPLFPTPPDALRGLDSRLTLATPAPRMLDAGCGAGDGLRALRSVWPQAQLEGVERSRVLAALAGWRCRWARVRSGDMWAGSWAPYDIVYLFQRPETMPRAWEKAVAEMHPGAWLVSLDFQVPGVEPFAFLQPPGRQAVWIYRPAGDYAHARAQGDPGPADIHLGSPGPLHNPSELTH